MSEAGIQATSTVAPERRSFVQRVLGVLRLDSDAYEEVASDPAAIGQAAVVVAAAAIGRAISAQGGPFGVQGLLFLVQVVAAWPVLSIMVFAMGRWFGYSAELPRVLRVMGFALAPFVLTALAVVPVWAVQVGVAFLSTALQLATFVVGVRHAVRTTTGRAGFLCIVIALVLVFTSMVYLYLST